MTDIGWFHLISGICWTLTCLWFSTSIPRIVQGQADGRDVVRLLLCFLAESQAEFAIRWLFDPAAVVHVETHELNWVTSPYLRAAVIGLALVVIDRFWTKWTQE